METQKAWPLGHGDGQPAGHQYEIRTSSLVLWPWGELAEQLGLGRDRARQFAGLTQAELRDPEVLVEQGRANRLAALITERHGSGAAMAAALTVQAGHFNIVELLARSAATVAGGLDMTCHFLPLLHVGGRLTHERVGGRSIALWHDPPRGEVHPGFVELFFGVGVEGIRRETGRHIVPERVWFRHPAPDDLRPYRALLGPNVRFAMPQALFELDANTAELPLLRRSVATRVQAAEVAEEALRQRQRQRRRRKA